jgi:hypothetical protein
VYGASRRPQLPDRAKCLKTIRILWKTQRQQTQPGSRTARCHAHSSPPTPTPPGPPSVRRHPPTATPRPARAAGGHPGRVRPAGARLRVQGQCHRARAGAPGRGPLWRPASGSCRRAASCAPCSRWCSASGNNGRRVSLLKAIIAILLIALSAITYILISRADQPDAYLVLIKDAMPSAIVVLLTYLFGSWFLARAG